jgi:hypothetical protein
MRKQNFDYAKAKRELRKLVKMGVSKREASVMAGIPYSTALLWTPDIYTDAENRISGITLRILKELVSNGYYLPNRNVREAFAYRLLRKSFPVKRVKSHGLVVYMMRGNERKAMEALLRKLNLKSVTYGRLGYIRKAFGVKSLKDDNKFRGRFVA